MKDAFELSDDARLADRELSRIDGEIDWLSLLTPNNLDQVSAGFRESGYKMLPPLEYPDIPAEFAKLRPRLMALPMRNLGSSEVETLLTEKQRELDRQIQLVRLRDRSGFVMASIDLFGDVDAALVDLAERVLTTVPTRDKPAKRTVDAKEFMAAAQREMDELRKQDSRFDFQVVEEPTPGTHIYTSAGNLHVAVDYRCAENRVEPLVQHEVGTHSVTRFNGRCQPLAVLECGLADYDALQEGIAVLAEYLAGDMPPSRLRVLAARVIAARMAIDDESPANIFARMYEEYHLHRETAFDTTVRALRGGGMTKDALYLDGLSDLLDYLGAGGSIEFLFIGKFALKQRVLLENLLEAGFLKRPAIIPKNFSALVRGERLTHIRQLKVEQFFTESVAS